MVCRGDGGWGRAERAPSAGDGCSAAGSGRRQAGSGSERRIDGWKSGRRAQKQRRLCRRKIANRRRAKRFFVLPPKCRRLLPSFRQGALLSFSRRCAKRFRAPAGERGGTSRLYEASDCRVRRFFVWLPLGGRPKGGADFCRCENLIKTEALCAASFWPDSRKTGGRLVGAAAGGCGVSLRAGKNRARAALFPCPANRRASGFCFSL